MYKSLNSHSHSLVDVSPFDGQVPVTAVPEDSDELDREAEWIYKKGFTEPTLTQQRGFMRSDCDEWKSKTATVEKIKKVKWTDINVISLSICVSRLWTSCGSSSWRFPS